MKSKEIRDLNEQELAARIKDEKELLNRMKFNHAITAIENPAKIKVARKGVARMKTILAEKQKDKK